MAIPLVFNSVVGMLIGLIDTAMIGRISLDAFGAVGLISTTINSITGVLGAIAVAFNIAGAKSEGKGNTKDLVDNFISGISISLFIGTLFWLILFAFGDGILKVVYGLQGSLLKESLSYMNLFSMTTCLNMMLFMFSSLFKILNTTKYLFIGNITATITNVILNYILIFGKLSFKPMGVKGAGIASVISLSLNLIIYVFILYKKKLIVIDYLLPIIKILKLGLRLIRKSLALMGQEILESTLLVVCINAILSRIGVLELSAYTLLESVVTIVLMPMYSYASTTLTLVSKNYGEKQYEKMSIIPRQSLKLALIISIGLIILLIIFKSYIVLLLTNDYNLINYSINYYIIALVACLFSIPNNIYKYGLQGIGDERWVLFNSIVINLIGIALVFLFSLVFKMGLYGLYLGITIDFILLSICDYLRFSNKVTNKKTETI